MKTKVLFSCILLSVFLASCQSEPQPIKVTGITLSSSSLSLTEGETADLTATISPKDANNQTVIWSSSNGSVASVSNGKVTALSPGTTTITAKSDDGGFTASCAVTVATRVIAVTSVSLSKTELTLVEGDFETITATVLPDNATDKTVTWSSSNTSVATVPSPGVVMAKAAGSATITVTTNDGEKTATCAVTVQAKTIAVNGVSLDKTSLTMTMGESQTLIATITPSNASNKSVTWSSSNSTVATVSTSGVVTAKAVGSATITVMTSDGEKTAECQVVVKEPTKATSISLVGANFIYSAKVGQEFSISVDIKPEDAYVDLEWSVSDESLAEIAGEGRSIVLRAKDFGPSTLTVRDKVSNLSVSETMRARLTDFYWTENSGMTHAGCPLVEIEIGEEHQLQCQYTPEYATRVFRSDIGGFWYYEPWGDVFDEPNQLVSKPSFFSINENGIIKGIKEGLAKIHVYSPIIINNAQDLYVRVVKKRIPVTGVSLPENIELYVGETKTISASIIPSDASNKDITWSCSDESIVSLSGASSSYIKTITALKKGSVVISATTNDGGYSSQCLVNVIEEDHVQSISLNSTNETMMTGDRLTLIATISPSSASNQSVVWSSSDDNVATVSDGVIAAISQGTTIITATTVDGGKTATCQLTVTNDIRSFIYATYNGGSIISVGGTIQSGSKLNFSISNTTQSKTITVKSIQLIDLDTGKTGNVMSINADIAGGSSNGWSITLGASMTTPQAKFVYSYDGEEYETTATYRAFSF